MKTPSYRAAVPASLLVLGMLAPSLATAQQAEAPIAQPAAAADTVDDVIVTAQKREQSVQDVAASVSAIGAQAIQQQGITDTTNLQFHVPSLVSGKLSGVTAVSIRGVGLNQYLPTAQPGVAVHIDGVYQARTLTGGLGQIDLARIEVLRGPQGTLYGRNATGGAVNFITAAPTDQLGGTLLAGYASYDELHLGGVINVPLGDDVRTRLVVDYTDRQSGFVENVVQGGPDADKGSVLSARFKLAADLSSTVGLDLAAYYLRREGGFPWLQLNSGPSASALANSPFLAGAVVPLEPHRFSADLAPSSSLDTYGTSATLNVEFGHATLKSITAYSWYSYRDLFDADGTNVAFSPETDIVKSNTVSQELNLSGKASRFDWLVGAFYMDDTLKSVTQFDFPNGYPAAGLVPGARLTQSVLPYRVKSAAIFTDNIFNVTETLRLIAGARYSEDKVEAHSITEINGLQVAPGVVLPSLITCPGVDTNPSFHSFTPRVGIQNDFTADVGGYASVSRGFKDGGVDGCNTVYQPETITAYEAGLRMRLLDGDLTLNPTVFHYQYDDFQVTQIRGLTSPVINAPEATVSGFELEAAWRATEHWSFTANGTLLDAKYGAGFSNTDSLNFLAGVQDLEGNRLNRAPKISGSVGVQYRSSMMPYGRFTLRGDLYASSRIYFREFNTDQDSQDAYQVANLNVIWDSPAETYSLRAFVNNAGDEAYLAQLGSTDAYGARFAAYAPPRQYGFEVRTKF